MIQAHRLGTSIFKTRVSKRSSMLSKVGDLFQITRESGVTIFTVGWNENVIFFKFFYFVFVIMAQICILGL